MGIGLQLPPKKVVGRQGGSNDPLTESEDVVGAPGLLRGMSL